MLVVWVHLALILSVASAVSQQSQSQTCDVEVTGPLYNQNKQVVWTQDFQVLTSVTYKTYYTKIVNQLNTLICTKDKSFGQHLIKNPDIRFMNVNGMVSVDILIHLQQSLLASLHHTTTEVVTIVKTVIIEYKAADHLLGPCDVVERPPKIVKVSSPTVSTVEVMGVLYDHNAPVRWTKEFLTVQTVTYKTYYNKIVSQLNKLICQRDSTWGQHFIVHPDIRFVKVKGVVHIDVVIRIKQTKIASVHHTKEEFIRIVRQVVMEYKATDHVIGQVQVINVPPCPPKTVTVKKPTAVTVEVLGVLFDHDEPVRWTKEFLTVQTVTYKTYYNKIVNQINTLICKKDSSWGKHFIVHPDIRFVNVKGVVHIDVVIKVQRTKIVSTHHTKEQFLKIVKQVILQYKAADHVLGNVQVVEVPPPASATPQIPQLPAPAVPSTPPGAVTIEIMATVFHHNTVVTWNKDFLTVTSVTYKKYYKLIVDQLNALLCKKDKLYGDHFIVNPKIRFVNVKGVVHTEVVIQIQKSKIISARHTVREFVTVVQTVITQYKSVDHVLGDCRVIQFPCNPKKPVPVPIPMVPKKPSKPKLPPKPCPKPKPPQQKPTRRPAPPKVPPKPKPTKKPTPPKTKPPKKPAPPKPKPTTKPAPPKPKPTKKPMVPGKPSKPCPPGKPRPKPAKPGKSTSIISIQILAVLYHHNVQVKWCSDFSSVTSVTYQKYYKLIVSQLNTLICSRDKSYGPRFVLNPEVRFANVNGVVHTYLVIKVDKAKIIALHHRIEEFIKLVQTVLVEYKGKDHIFGNVHIYNPGTRQEHVRTVGGIPVWGPIVTKLPGKPGKPKPGVVLFEFLATLYHRGVAVKWTKDFLKFESKMYKKYYQIIVKQLNTLLYARDKAYGKQFITNPTVRFKEHKGRVRAQVIIIIKEAKLKRIGRTHKQFAKTMKAVVLGTQTNPCIRECRVVGQNEMGKINQMFGVTHTVSSHMTSTHHHHHQVSIGTQHMMHKFTSTVSHSHVSHSSSVSSHSHVSHFHH